MTKTIQHNLTTPQIQGFIPISHLQCYVNKLETIQFHDCMYIFNGYYTIL